MTAREAGHSQVGPAPGGPPGAVPEGSWCGADACTAARGASPAAGNCAPPAEQAVVLPGGMAQLLVVGCLAAARAAVSILFAVFVAKYAALPVEFGSAAANASVSTAAGASARTPIGSSVEQAAALSDAWTFFGQDGTAAALVAESAAQAEGRSDSACLLCAGETVGLASTASAAQAACSAAAMSATALAERPTAAAAGWASRLTGGSDTAPKSELAGGSSPSLSMSQWLSGSVPLREVVSSWGGKAGPRGWRARKFSRLVSDTISVGLACAPPCARPSPRDCHARIDRQCVLERRRASAVSTVGGCCLQRGAEAGEMRKFRIGRRGCCGDTMLPRTSVIMALLHRISHRPAVLQLLCKCLRSIVAALVQAATAAAVTSSKLQAGLCRCSAWRDCAFCSCCKPVQSCWIRAGAPVTVGGGCRHRPSMALGAATDALAADAPGHSPSLPALLAARLAAAGTVNSVNLNSGTLCH